MKKLKLFSTLYMVAMLLTIGLSSCQLVGDIFKAGVWVGILFVVVIIGVVIFLAVKLFGGGK